MNYTTENRLTSKLLVKKSSAIIAGLILLFGGATIYTWRQFATTTEPEPTTEQTLPEIKTVTALGRLEPVGEVRQLSISSFGEGSRVEEILMTEGETVSKGQVIAILDSRDRAVAALKQAEARVAIAQANLAQVKAGAKTGEIQAQQATIARIEAERNNNMAAQAATVSRMEAELKNAQLEYQRFQKLFTQGAVTASARDTRELTLATAQQQLAEAKANLTRIESAEQLQIAEARATLNRIAEVRPVDVALANAEVKEAEAAVITAQADLDLAYIKSPQAGKIIKILTLPGEVVDSDGGIVRIGQTDQMYAIAEVYESDISKVKIGQTAKITSSAISDSLSGTVEKIGLEIQRQEVVNTDPTANIDAKVVEVKVKLDEASSEKVTSLTNLLVNVQIQL